LRGALEFFSRDQGISAGFILSAVGSLSLASLRFAGLETSHRITGGLEILSIAGTLSTDGCHLHAAVSDERGEVGGGHVTSGCTVRTAKTSTRRNFSARR